MELLGRKIILTPRPIAKQGLKGKQASSSNLFCVTNAKPPKYIKKSDLLERLSRYDTLERNNYIDVVKVNYTCSIHSYNFQLTVFGYATSWYVVGQTRISNSTFPLFNLEKLQLSRTVASYC